MRGGVLSNSPFVNPIETKAAAAEVYTLDGSKLDSKYTKYNNAGESAQGNVTWSVTGNMYLTNTGYWGIGGKSITGVDRTVFSKDSIADSVGRVELDVGSASSITVNSLKLIVASDKDFNTKISIVDGNFVANSTITFANPGANWSGAYYKFIFNVTVSGTNNKYVQFKAAHFFEPEETGELTSLKYDGIPVLQEAGKAFDATGLSFKAILDNDDSKNRDVAIKDIAFTPETLSADTKKVTATYQSVSCDIPVKVKGDLTSISVSGTPATQYIGDTFNPTGLTFTAHYGELSETIEAKDITFAPEAIEAGTKIVVATYKEKTVDITGFAVEQKSSYLFVDNDEGSFDEWGTSYGSHDITFGGKVKVNFSGAAKPTTTITDCPVTRDAQTTTFEAVDGAFAMLKVNFVRWGDRTPTLEVWVDGAKVGNTFNFPADGTSIVWNAEEGQSAKTVLIKTTATTKQQIGWKSFEFKLAETAQESYAAKFLEDTASDCAAGNVTAETWAALETAFNALSEEEKATYKTAVADDTEMGQAIARYDFIIGKYAALNDFMGRGTGTSGLSNLRMSINNQTSMIALISAFSLGLVAAGAYFISKKRKSVR